jgi:hypothetical protein
MPSQAHGHLLRPSTNCYKLDIIANKFLRLPAINSKVV